MTLPYEAQIPRVIDADTGLPTGPLLVNPAPAPRPQRVVLEGRFCRLEPLDPVRHGDDLYRASTPPDAKARFLYLFEEAPDGRAEFQTWLEKVAVSDDPLFFAVIDKRTGRCEGRQTLMRIDPANQCIEIGSIYWGPIISRTPVTTEANFLFARYAFDTLGYRRYEWKCNALNAPSRRAAGRFGFSYEGHFRRATIAKGRSRDTTWYAMIGEDWPQLCAAYERWLAPENFDAAGGQRLTLASLTQSALATRDVALRRAQTGDLQPLVALQRAAYARNRTILGVEPLPLQAEYADVLTSKEVWVADNGDEITGALILEANADHLLIWSIATAPAQQQRGLGKILLAAAETRAQQLGLKTIRLYTGTKLAHLVAWYGRHGFVVDSVEQLDDRSKTNMSKKLD